MPDNLKNTKKKKKLYLCYVTKEIYEKIYKNIKLIKQFTFFRDSRDTIYSIFLQLFSYLFQFLAIFSIFIFM